MVPIRNYCISVYCYAIPIGNKYNCTYVLIDSESESICRFGAAVSPLIQKEEQNEAIKRRQERFGIVSKDEPQVQYGTGTVPTVSSRYGYRI